MNNRHGSLWLFFLLIAMMIFSTDCGRKKTSAAGTQRPHQPWVFRSVLDTQSRMLTLALHDDLWAAYHTDSCSLYKVWKGYVHLQGAVYDNAHGPQPISIGDAWMVNNHKKPWQVMKDGANVLKEVQYAGHVLKSGSASLLYNLICNDGTSIKVSEQPEAIANRDGQIGFERKFHLEKLPAGYTVSIDQNVMSVALRNNIQTNGDWKINNESKADFDKKQVLTLDGVLTLNEKEDTYFRTLFISKPTINNPTALQSDEA